MAADRQLAALGETFITHRFPAASTAQAFLTARSTKCLKAVVQHDPSNWT
jgi:hypothetical protein